MIAHKKQPEVKQLLDDEQSGKISKSDRIKAFSEFQYRIAKSHYDLIAECLCARQKVMCSGCSGFFKKAYYYRHRKKWRPIFASSWDEPCRISAIT